MRANNLLWSLILIVFGYFNLLAQEKSPKIDLKISGFVRTDFMLDTRQVVSAREGQFLLFPQNVKLDPNGNDINARANFNYLAIISRASITVTGPELWNARTTAFLEGDFFGHQDQSISSFRLRHGFIKLNWEKWEVLTGRYWHPMFDVESYPKTVSFNTGVPFQWLSRNGQIRITRKAGNFKIMGAVVTQRDFASPGGPDALRNSLLPDLQGQIRYDPNEQLHLGVTLGYKQLLPRLATDSGYVTTSMVRGFSSNFFLKYTKPDYIFQCYASLLQNGYDGLALGGYAVRAVTDPMQDQVEYVALNSTSFWGEIYTRNLPVELGVFAGYTKNLGAIKEIENLSGLGRYSRGSNIAYEYRIAPRIVYQKNFFKLGTEVEYTTAAYSGAFTEQGVPLDPNEVSNVRVLVAVTYIF
jgi:hypothetical protein